MGRQWDWRTMAVMTGRITPAPCPFTPQEREYIRRELDMFFGTLPSVAEGFQLRTWRGGPLAGQPKVPPPVRTMVERGLVEIRIGTRVPKVHFSEAGLAALRLLALDRRYMDPQKFAHVRAELGLEATIEWSVSSTQSPRVEINIDDGLKRLGGRDASKRVG